MLKKYSNFWSTLILTLACFLFTYFVFGFYYVEYEALANSFLSGKVTPGVPFKAIYFLMHHGTSHVYSFLYQTFPDVEWLSWILYSYFFLATLLTLYIIGMLVPKDRPWWEKLMWQLVVYFFVFADHNIHFIFTRISYLTVGASFLGLIYFFKTIQSIKDRPLLFVLLNVLFTLGALCRIESSAALGLLVFVYAMVYLKSFKQTFILLFYPGLFLGVFILGLTYHIRNNPAFYALIEPEIEVQFVERQNKVPLSYMKTKEDSAKYKIAAEIAWVDPNIITPDFLRSMIQEEQFMFTDGRQWKRVLGDVLAVVERNLSISIFSLVITLLLVWQLPQDKYKWLFYFCFFWFYLLIQAYTFKINDRSFLPNIAVYLASIFIVFIPTFYFSNTKKSKLGLSFSIVLLFLAFQVRYLSKEADILKTDLEKYRFNTRMVEDVARGKYLVVNSSSFDYVFLSHEPFKPFDYSAFKKIYITDGHVIPYIPYYRDFLEKDCKCDVYNFPSFWNYIKTIRNQVVIMSTLGRMEVLREYMKVLHNYQLNIEPIKHPTMQKVRKSDYRDVYWDLEMYELKSDTMPFVAD